MSFNDLISEECPRCHGFVWHRRDPCRCKPVKAVSFDKAEWLLAVGRRIRSLREAQKLSQEGLADRCGMSKTGIWQIEKGQSEPGAMTVALLAEALKTTADHLLLMECR